jgi:hypothetical protein
MVHQARTIAHLTYFDRLYCAEKFIRLFKTFNALTPQQSILPVPTSPRAIKIMLKDFFTCNSVRFLLDSYIPKLKHHNDGLIFTKNSWNYTAGTCP